MPKKPHIALLMMVKNETKRLQVTLDSIVGHVDSMVIYDTGSTDNTIEILKNHSKKHNIPLHLKEGSFVDFSTSRNVSLEFADSFNDIDYCILLDCNDELKGGENLRKFCKDEMGSDSTGYLVCQEWFSGKYDKYFNMRLVKTRRGWRYKGSVHEWLADTSLKKGEKAKPVKRLPDNIILYQDRTKDDDKSGKRFKRDRELLLSDYKKNPQEPRTLFYLAQTCACLHLYEEALYYYKLRSDLEGFQEEKFHAYLRCGDMSEKLGMNWHSTMIYYMKAVEHSLRAEPLIKIAEYYKNKKQWAISFMYIKSACILKYPEKCILFVDKHGYDYTRWHIMGIVAYYCGQYADGKNGCLKAIKCGLNSELDKSNLKFYEDKEKELRGNVKEVKSVTKKVFIRNNIDELKIKFPNLTRKKISSMALSRWKSLKKV